MAFPLAHRSTARVLAGLRHSPSSLYSASHIAQRRSLFNFFRRSKQNKQNEPPEPVPLLTEDNLVHPFSKSPFPQVRARGEVICSMAPCPVCAASHSHTHAHIQAQPKTVKFECPDCGWPTHCSEEHWKEDKEHEKYCSRLREANEDEHDLRSGRRMPEFELPGRSCRFVRSESFDAYTVQVLRDTKRPSLLQTGMSFGTRVVSIPWTANGHVDTPVNSSHIL